MFYAGLPQPEVEKVESVSGQKLSAKMRYVSIKISLCVLNKVNVKTNPKAYFCQNNFCQSGYSLAEKKCSF